MAHLLFALRGEGCFALLTGEVGTGKTLVCRCLLEQLPEEVQVALIINPRLTVNELLITICDELGVSCPSDQAGTKGYVDRLNRYLLDAHGAGKTVVLIIDEAQNLSAEVLEQLRLLTNLETRSHKLLQVVLVGQPELRALLQRQDLRQLAQRITARYHLGPLGRNDLAAYLTHRLEVAGVRRPLFSAAGRRRLFRLSGGIPRLINIIADRALLGAYGQGRHQVNAALVSAAAREVGVLVAPRWLSRRLVGEIVLLLVVVCCWWWIEVRQPAEAVNPALTPMVAASPVSQQPPHAKSDPVADETWFSRTDAAGSSPQVAWTALLHLWGDPFPVSDATCQIPPESGFACLEGSATLETLRALDRPAILRLQSADGTDLFALLAGLDGDRAVLAMKDRVGFLSVARLQELWSGDFSLLWQPSTAPVAQLQAGSSGPAVEWLDACLALAGVPGREGDSKSDFDPALTGRVKQYQLRQGILPDGIVGPRTMILLTNLLAAPGPRLTDLFGKS
nr:AAA family ATPase [Desulfuromonas sp. DDH964]